MWGGEALDCHPKIYLLEGIFLRVPNYHHGKKNLKTKLLFWGVGGGVGVGVEAYGFKTSEPPADF